MERIRSATGGDLEPLRLLVERSVRALHRGEYSEREIEVALQSSYLIDPYLIEDGTYFVVEIDGERAGCGGWSRRAKTCGGLAPDDRILDPTREPARIRAFYVAPECARRGIGSRLLAACEEAAQAAGFTQFALGATLVGAHLYERHGYVRMGESELRLADDVRLRVVNMEKRTASRPLRKISLAEKFASFDERWSPKTLATVGEFAVKAVKIEGEFVWHDHAEDDELFFVIRGAISMQYRTGGVEAVERFGPGEMLRVPRGVMHRPIADPGTEILLFERESVVNTGDVR